MPRLIALGLLLAACAAPPLQGAGGFRAQTTPIWSSAVFDAARLAGDWTQTALFTQGPDWPCAQGRIRIAQGSQAMGALCLDGGLRQVSGPVAALGPGRFSVPGLPGPVWVLWADTGYRTLALGSPEGRFGLILERGPGATPPDRLAAAREIFAWNGYDLARFRGLE